MMTVIAFILASVLLPKGVVPSVQERLPHDVNALPAAIRADLERRHCTMPRWSNSPADEALVRAPFHDNPALDWAVVCTLSAQRIQQVLVYTQSAKGWTGEKIEAFTWSEAEWENRFVTVSAAGPKEIRGYAKAFAPDEMSRLPPLTHQGVEVNFEDKASTVHYFHNGQWLALQGAD